jgi:hypothetical protein
VGEAEAGGNHLLEFRGFESLPVKPSPSFSPSNSRNPRQKWVLAIVLS